MRKDISKKILLIIMLAALLTSILTAPLYAAVPFVQTGGVTHITNDSAEVSITTYEGYSITERGVAYSSGTSNPRVGASNCKKATTFGKTGDNTVYVENLQAGTQYYVRAYAKNSDGKYGYGEVAEFRTDNSTMYPKVKTVSAAVGANYEVTVEIDVIGDGGYGVSERGILYSTSRMNPTKGDRSCKAITANGNEMGKTAVTAELTADTDTYYIRSYVMNARAVAYGQTLEVKANKTSLSTKAAKNIKSDSAELGGNVVKDINSFVTERGVVYAASPAPTIKDLSVKADTTAAGEFTVSLSDLTSNSKYYARAYIKTATGYAYGNEVNFQIGAGSSDTSSNTPAGNGNLTVAYQLENGTQVGSQIVNAAKNQLITEKSLNIPWGYKLADLSYSHTASGTPESVIVIVESTGSPLAYMEGYAFYRFQPERKASRVEIAKCIYSLRGKPKTTENIPTFSDITSVFKDKAAIDYVTSMDFMNGYPEGNFKPFNDITRAEMAVVVNKVYGLAAGNKATFSDTQGHWAEEAIAVVNHAGLLQGYPDGSFKPDKPITRAEACVLFAQAENRVLMSLGTEPFADVPATHWAYDYIMNAATPRP